MFRDVAGQHTADVKTLIPVVDRIRSRFHIGRFYVVADRGMISEETMNELDQREIPYILGTRMRKLKEIREEVLARAGRYREVYPEGKTSKDPVPLKVKEVWVDQHRYILCLNEKQARKEALDRQVIVDALKEQLKKNPKSLIGNKGYRKYLKLDRGHLRLDQDKIDGEERFNGKWVLRRIPLYLRSKWPSNTRNSGKWSRSFERSSRFSKHAPSSTSVTRPSRTMCSVVFCPLF